MLKCLSSQNQGWLDSDFRFGENIACLKGCGFLFWVMSQKVISSYLKSLPRARYTELYKLCNVLHLLSVFLCLRLGWMLICWVFQPLKHFAISTLICELSKQLLMSSRATKRTPLRSAGVVVTKRYRIISVSKWTVDKTMSNSKTEEEQRSQVWNLQLADKYCLSASNKICHIFNCWWNFSFFRVNLHFHELLIFPFTFFPCFRVGVDPDQDLQPCGDSFQVLQGVRIALIYYCFNSVWLTLLMWFCFCNFMLKWGQSASLDTHK